MTITWLSFMTDGLCPTHTFNSSWGAQESLLLQHRRQGPWAPRPLPAGPGAWGQLDSHQCSGPGIRLGHRQQTEETGVSCQLVRDSPSQVDADTVKPVFHYKYTSNTNKGVQNSCKTVLKQDPLCPPLLANCVVKQVHLFQDLGFSPHVFYYEIENTHTDKAENVYRQFESITKHVEPLIRSKIQRPPASWKSPLSVSHVHQNPPLPEATTDSLPWNFPCYL